MGFRSFLFPLLVLTNLYALLELRRTVSVWVKPERRRRAMVWISAAVFLLNLPLLAFFFRGLDLAVDELPTWVLQSIFYPATAWVATLLAFFLIAGPIRVAWAMGKASLWAGRKFRRWNSPPAPGPAASGPALSRRSFLAGSGGLLIPGIFGVAAYGSYSSFDDIEVSGELPIPIPNLPRALEGLTLVQLSDLHVGPYIRERELEHVVSLTNRLRPDLVLITGDVLDRHLSTLPGAVRGLRGLRAGMGVFAVLGNHDIYADPYSYADQREGGVHIVRGLESAGIRTLRNEVTHVGSGQDRLALLGLDWLTSDPRSRNFYRYRQEETRKQLSRLVKEAGPEAPMVLLAHHPDTFSDAAPLGIGLTLSGHTHGGGQVIVGHWNGTPIGVATLRFKYLSGLYQQGGYSCYVNRGIGYLGIPIRINCPPEISRFKLVRQAAT